MHKNDKCSLHNVLLYTPSQNTNTEIQIQNTGREIQKYKMHTIDKCPLHNVLLYTPSQNINTEIQNTGWETKIQNALTR